MVIAVVYVTTNIDDDRSRMNSHCIRFPSQISLESSNVPFVDRSIDRWDVSSRIVTSRASEVEKCTVYTYSTVLTATSRNKHPIRL
jgi:hypothetical protein